MGSAISTETKQYVKDLFEVYTAIITEVKKLINFMKSINQLDKITNEVRTAINQLEKQEREAFEKLVQLRFKATEAVERADDTVKEIDRITQDILKKMSKRRDELHLREAMKSYTRQSATLLQQVEDAVKELRQVSNDAVSVDGTVKVLINFIEKEKWKLSNQIAADQRKTRAAAYGGAAAAMAAVTSGNKQRSIFGQ